MKTGQLVDLLVADRTVLAAPHRTLLLAFLPACAVALALFLLIAGLRPDLPQQIGNPRLLYKISLNAMLVVVGCGLLLRRARPLDDPGPWRMGLWAVAVALLAGVVVELTLLPRDQWWVAARGSNATWCLRMIPTLAIAPLGAGLWTLRRAAPAHAAQAGAAAGLLSAAVGGLLYALHCPDDSPLFVAMWYGLATAGLAVAGALLGRRALRW